METGIKIINVHHANDLNPFINYPFMTADSIKAFADEWHGKGCKVKLYYTIRELSRKSGHCAAWAMKSCKAVTGAVSLGVANIM